MTAFATTGSISEDLAGPAAVETEAPVDPGLQVEAVYRTFALDVNRYALSLTRDPEEAADITSEVFERAVRAARRLSFPMERPLPWLLLAARHASVDKWRRASRLAKSIARLPRSLTGSTDYDRSEGLVWLEAVTAVLPPRQREALFLRYHYDLPDSEIAVILGLSDSGVRSLLARGIASLRAHEEMFR